MKRSWFAVALLFLSSNAFAATARVQQTVTIDVPGVTAAYAIDPTIAGAKVSSVHEVAVTGMAAGTTQIVAVTPGGARTFAITIEAAPLAAAAVRRNRTDASVAHAEMRYVSGANQLQNLIDVFRSDGDRRSQLHVFNIRYFDAASGRSRFAFPTASYRISSPRRDLTLLDELVDVSPLTIRSTQIRGLHLRQGPLELHAGYAASTMYEDLFVPADRRWVAGAGYAIDAGRMTLTPSAYAFLSQPRDTAARRGAVGSLAAEIGRSDAFRVRGELAMSRSLAASADVRYENGAGVLRGDLSYKRDDFPTLGVADLPGIHGHAGWSGRATKRLDIDAYATFDRTKTAAFDQTIALTNTALRYAVSPRLSVISGIDSSIVRSASSPQLRTVGLPLGVSYDGLRYGAAASYRIVDNSQAGRRGDALRLSARATNGALHVDAWVERERQTPRVDLIFRDLPGLATDLARLGISVHSPEELSRILADSAILINLGYIEGVTVNLTPQRSQAGIDAGYTSRDDRNHVRLHGVFDRADGIAAIHDQAIATLSYSRRVRNATEVYGAYTWWQTSVASRDLRRSSFDVGLRHRFDALPSVLQRGGDIEGVVFLDPEMRGVPAKGAEPLSGVVVTLDDARSEVTDAKGMYRFRGVAAGQHRVSAVLGARQAAYFTTASAAEIRAPGRADFGLVWSPARIIGRVESDAAAGVAGVEIVASTKSGAEVAARTNSEGNFTIVVPPGAITVSLRTQSLPSGFTSNAPPIAVIAAADAPRRIAFAVRALRSIAGKTDRGAEVRIEPLGRTVTSDGDGNFVFRSLPEGTYTVRAAGASRTFVLPAGPATVSDVVLSSESPR